MFGSTKHTSVERMYLGLWDIRHLKYCYEILCQSINFQKVFKNEIPPSYKPVRINYTDDNKHGMSHLSFIIHNAKTGIFSTIHT